MTINADQTHSEYLNDLHDDGGSLASPSEVESRIESDFEQMGTLYTDQGAIPSTATVRESGTFTDPWAAMEYLSNGGLHATDDMGDLVPIGFVYFYQYFDDLLQQDAYVVYIDEDTN